MHQRQKCSKNPNAEREPIQSTRMDIMWTSKSPFSRREVLKIAGVGVAGITGMGQVTATKEQLDENSDPTEIEDWHDLDAIRDNLDGEYVLVDDLNPDTQGYDEHVAEPDAGWEPIPGGDVFTGTLDGDGHEIVGLAINRPDEEAVGLFGSIFDAILENVTLSSLDVTGEHSVGGIAGTGSNSTITNCHVNGDVVGEETRVGGIIGSYNGSVVTKSSSQAAVEGASTVGGLVGLALSETTISLSASSSAVTGRQGIGGLIGNLIGGSTVTKSYATGDVTDKTLDDWGRIGPIGGLVGSTSDSSLTNIYAGGTISHPKSEDEIDFDDTLGGIVGGSDGSEIMNAYWDVETTNQNDGIGTGDDTAIGLETTEMQGDAAQDNMDMLDFEETWVTATNPDNYPLLQWQDSDGDPAVEDYTNENGLVETEGLREAITDWRTGDIGTELLRDVIGAWRSSEPIE